MTAPDSRQSTPSYLSAMHRSSPINTTISSPSPNTLPRDVAAVRKTRINNDLITLFKRPCPPNSVPTAKGIGLYTHVAGPAKTPLFPHEKYVQSDPEFLPIGGTRRVGKRAGLEAQMTDEEKKVWREVKEAVEEEEKALGSNKMSLDELKKRHGALDVPKSTDVSNKTKAQQQQVQLRTQDAATRDNIAGLDGTSGTNPQPTNRRSSLGGGLRVDTGGAGDVVMGGMESERKGSPVVKSGSSYNAHRDPRKQGRRSLKWEAQREGAQE